MKRDNSSLVALFQAVSIICHMDFQHHLLWSVLLSKIYILSSYVYFSFKSHCLDLLSLSSFSDWSKIILFGLCKSTCEYPATVYLSANMQPYSFILLPIHYLCNSSCICLSVISQQEPGFCIHWLCIPAKAQPKPELLQLPGFIYTHSSLKLN